MIKLRRPTPAKWRKYGDILLAISLAAAAYEVTYEHPYLGYLAVGTGIAAKIIIAALTATPENGQKDNGIDPN